MMNDRPPPAVLLQRITESGVIDIEAAEWIVDALSRWLAGIDWQRATGLTSPDRARIAQRDFWLQQAAAGLNGTAWQRARQLHQAARRFESRQWPTWKRGTLPPADATDSEVCLFLAMRSGATLPATPQAFLSVLNKKL